mgnify:CR=1 FL=1
MDVGLINTVKDTAQTLINSPAVDGVVTALITTLFLRKNEDIKIIEDLKKKEFEKVTQELLNSGRMSYVEFYKTKNFLKIAQQADEMMANQKQSEDAGEDNNKCQNNFSFDWLMRFFDAVGNISDKDLQQLWAKVLAGEIAEPKTCSLRTLDMIRNMSSEEAEIFSNLCKYVMQSGDSYYIDSAGFMGDEERTNKCKAYMKKQGLSYEGSIVPLVEAGAFSTDHDLAIYLHKNVTLVMYNKKITGIVMKYEEEPSLFQRDAYWLTASGRELFHTICQADNFEVDKEYALLCLKDIEKKNPEFYVGAFKNEREKENLLERV